MKRLEENFKWKGVSFSLVKRGVKAVVLKASAEFYPDNCVSYEVWQLRESKEREIAGSIVAATEKKANNEDYPYTAHQFMSYHYSGGEKEMVEKVEKRFQEYETGIRPKSILD